MVDDVVAGKATEAQYYEVGMAQDGGMDVVINPAWQDRISAEAMATYEQKLADIRSGAFDGPDERRSDPRRVPARDPAQFRRSERPRSTASTWRCGPARCTPCSARTGRARPR